MDRNLIYWPNYSGETMLSKQEEGEEVIFGKKPSTISICHRLYWLYCNKEIAKPQSQLETKCE
jgi:hypothetical protein